MEAKPSTLLEAINSYAAIDAALGEASESRWPNGVQCPRCGADGPMFLRSRRIWKCSSCRKQFSFKAGTVMEDSPIGLDKWLPAIWMIANDRNGISSHELGRALGVTQKTAWFMLHRIRLAMQDDFTGGNLAGEIEIDETFIGGKVRNMHKDRKRKVQAKHGQKGGKAIVLGILERASEGKPKRVRTSILNDRKKVSIAPEVMAHVEKGSKVYTDEFGDSWIDRDEYTHQMVNHLAQYVNGNCHTNGIENFWALLKRAIGGTYVSVEPFHLFRYVDEQAFRFNNRIDADGEKVSDYERFKAALNQVVGKRLTYQALIGKEAQTASEEEVPF